MGGDEGEEEDVLSRVEEDLLSRLFALEERSRVRSAKDSTSCRVCARGVA